MKLSTFELIDSGEPIVLHELTVDELKELAGCGLSLMFETILTYMRTDIALAQEAVSFKTSGKYNYDFGITCVELYGSAPRSYKMEDIFSESFTQGLDLYVFGKLRWIGDYRIGTQNFTRYEIAIEQASLSYYT